jgi:hypothetical protein
MESRRLTGGYLCRAERRLRHCRLHCGRAVRDDADLHRDDGIGFRDHRLEDLTLVWRRVGQHGVQDDDARHPDLVQQVEDPPRSHAP